jgi:DNA-binding transcriptional ArsR family regulator
LEEIKGRPVRVIALALYYPISLNAISKHIKALERAGLIKRNIGGRVHICEANPRQLMPANDWIKKYTNF